MNPDIPNQSIRSYLNRYGEISSFVFPLSAGYKDELSHVDSSTSTNDRFTMFHHKKGPKNKQRLKALQNAASTIFETTDDDVSNDVTTNDNSTDNDKAGDKPGENDITIDNNTNTDLTMNTIRHHN